MLVLGNYLANWTFYKDMYTIHPDRVTSLNHEGDSRVISCQTISISVDRSGCGWNELIDEMHSLVVEAILKPFRTNNKWTIPLSSGLDSRLIATVGAEYGIDMSTYTFGPSNTKDVVYFHANRLREL